MVYLTMTHRYGFLPTPIRMTLYYLECTIQLKERLTDGTLVVYVSFGADHT